LEPHFQLHLTHPLKTRAPRARNSDFRDAQRLAARWSAGDLEESFIPGSEQRAWRWLTRTRVQLKKKLGVIHSHVEGLLEQGGIKLSAVVSDLFGVSGWAMLEHISQGITDIEVLAGKARGAQRKKDAELKEALAGKLEPVYRLLLGQGESISPMPTLSDRLGRDPCQRHVLCRSVCPFEAESRWQGCCLRARPRPSAPWSVNSNAC
jgi:hypothetical protein